MAESDWFDTRIVHMPGPLELEHPAIKVTQSTSRLTKPLARILSQSICSNARWRKSDHRSTLSIRPVPLARKGAA